MRLRAAFLLLLALGGGAAAKDRSPAGEYRLVGEPDVASGLALRRDGSFEYFLIAGALDERSSGRWSLVGKVVTLVTEPKPIPPVFEPGLREPATGGPLRVKVSWPDGTGVALVNLRIGFDEGEPVQGYTQEDGWALPEEERRIPRWIELAVPMHGLASPRFPIDTADGNILAFILVPNDLGLVDLDGVRIEVERKALVLHRGGGRLRYEAVRK